MTKKAPPNKGPVVIIEVTPGNLYVDQPVTIDVSKSYDEQGTIKKMEIHPGDGTLPYKLNKPASVTHTYTAERSYEILVEAEDNKGSKGNNKMQIGILQIGTGNITVPNQSASFDSPTGVPITVTYPPPPVPTGGVEPYIITYSKAANSLFPIGITIVNIVAQDSVGNSGLGTLTITVVDTTPPPPLDPPVFTATPSTIDEGDSSLLTLTLDPAGSYENVLINGVPPVFNGTVYELEVSPLVTTVYISTADISGVPQDMPTVVVIVTDTPDPPDPPGPVIVVPPANQIVESPDGNPVSRTWSAATASGGTAPYTIVYKIGATVITSPHLFPVGTSTVDITATDALAQTGTNSFTVTITYEPDPPAPSEGHPRIWINDSVGAPESRAIVGTKLSTGGSLFSDYQTFVNYLEANWVTDFGGTAIFAALGYAFVYTMYDFVTGISYTHSENDWGDRANALGKYYISVITPVVGEAEQEGLGVVYDWVNDRLSSSDKVIYADWFKTVDNLTGATTPFGVVEVSKRMCQLIFSLALDGDGVLFTGGASADTWSANHIAVYPTKWRSTVGTTVSSSQLGGNDGTSPIGISYDFTHIVERAFRAEEAYRTVNGISKATHYGGTSGANDARYFRYLAENILYRILPWAPASGSFPGGRQYRLEKGFYMTDGVTVANVDKRVLLGYFIVGSYTGVDSDVAGLGQWLLENRIGTSLSLVNFREQVFKFILAPVSPPTALSPTTLGLATNKSLDDGRFIFRQDWTSTSASYITFEALKWMRDLADHDGYWPGAFQFHRNGPAIVNQGGVGSHDWGMGGYSGSSNILTFPNRTTTITSFSDDQGAHRRGCNSPSDMRGSIDFVEDAPADRRGRTGQSTINEFRNVLADGSSRLSSYVYADLTRGYSSEDYTQSGLTRKIQSNIRQFVVFTGANVASDPDIAFIFDRAIISILDVASGGITMEWLYHTSGEPIVTGTTSSAAGPMRNGHTQGHTTYSGGSPVITATNNVNGSNNRCWLTPIYPVVNVIKIWGPNGSGQSWQADSHEYETPYGYIYSNNYSGGSADVIQYDAQGRIELHPATPLITNQFLNVIEVAPSSSSSKTATSGGVTATMAYAICGTKGAAFPLLTSAFTSGTFLVTVAGTYKILIASLNPSASRTFTPGANINIEGSGTGVPFVVAADSQGTVELDIVVSSSGSSAANTITIS